MSSPLNNRFDIEFDDLVSAEASSFSSPFKDIHIDDSDYYFYHVKSTAEYAAVLLIESELNPENDNITPKRIVDALRTASEQTMGSPRMATIRSRFLCDELALAHSFGIITNITTQVL